MESANQLTELLGDLKDCEKEPLQFIGAVQGHGALIAFTLSDQRIQSASENIKEFAGVVHRETIGAKLGHILGTENAEEIIAKCRELQPGTSRASVVLKIGEDSFDGTVFTTDGLHFVEFEKLEDGFGDLKERFRQEDELKRCLQEIGRSKKLQQQALAVCRAVQRITGLDRVMMYRFLAPHWHGEVIAEHRVLSAHSFMQHRFPASDIPRMARDLYLRNGVRLIPDTEMPTVQVKPAINPATRHEIDLSEARLRAVSPIHLEYLRNMGVRCSFSVAVIVEGRLWGLIACHHLSAKKISISQRNACELIAGAFAGTAGMVEINDVQLRKLIFAKKLRDIMDAVMLARNPVDELMKRHVAVLEAFSATGLALVKNLDEKATCDLVGLTPLREQVVALATKLRDRFKGHDDGVVAIDSLAEEMPEFEAPVQLACGILSVQVGLGCQLTLYRPEQIETITWGGDPRKQLDRKGFQGRINPRASFETWEETIKGRSRVWEDYEIEGFQHLAEAVFKRLAVVQKA